MSGQAGNRDLRDSRKKFLTARDTSTPRKAVASIRLTQVEWSDVQVIQIQHIVLVFAMKWHKGRYCVFSKGK